MWPMLQPKNFRQDYHLCPHIPKAPDLSRDGNKPWWVLGCEGKKSNLKRENLSAVVPASFCFGLFFFEKIKQLDCHPYLHHHRPSSPFASGRTWFQRKHLPSTIFWLHPRYLTPSRLDDLMGGLGWKVGMQQIFNIMTSILAMFNRERFKKTWWNDR